LAASKEGDVSVKKFLGLMSLGFGLAAGGGLIYILATNQTAFIIFLALLMFVTGSVLAMGFALLLNRQWTTAMFGQQPPRVTNQYRLPAYPYPAQPQMTGPAGYLPEPAPQFEIVEPKTPDFFVDDKPVA